MISYKKRLVLGLFAGLLMFPPQLVSVVYVWDNNDAPATFKRRAMVAGSWALGGGLLGGGAGSVFFGKKYANMLVGFLSAAVLGVNRFLSYKNTPEAWLRDFSLAFDELAQLPLLASGNTWFCEDDLLVGAESLQISLRQAAVKITRLREVARILSGRKLLRADDLRPNALRDLHDLCSKRLLQVSVLVDFKAFHRSYDSFFGAEVLKSGPHHGSWMMKHGNKRSYPALAEAFGRADGHLHKIKDTASRLLGAEYAAFLTAADREDLSKKMHEIRTLEPLFVERSEFVLAHVRLENFNEAHRKLAPLGELNVAASVGDAWLNVHALRSGERFSLNDVQAQFDRIGTDLNASLSMGESLLREPQARYFSHDERSVIVAKVLAIKELRTVFNERQRILRGLLLVEAFDARYAVVMQPSVLRQSSFGANDLSWMQMPGSVVWPLQKVHQFLEASKKDVAALYRVGTDLLENPDFRVLSPTIKADCWSRVTNLQQMMALIDMRLLFLCNSTMYAQEVLAKLAQEELQRERARQERARQELQRHQAAVRREDERLARELDRQQRETQREEERVAQERERIRLAQMPRPSAPPMDAPFVQPVPSAPPAEPKVPTPVVRPSAPAPQQTLQSCFCGDDIPADKMYKLNCSCKSSFYHVDCIKKWVKDSKTCPTCRARVTLADIQKVGAFTPVAPEVPKPAPVKPVQPTVAPAPAVPTSAPAPVQVPVAPVEAEECYLCLDSDNVADCTTGNCDCTVKKAACRACLQDWLNRNHTCPNCRKTGAALVPLKP